MWRLTDAHAVIYTDDRATLKALLAYSRFPHDNISRAATYENKKGKVFAWQFTFPMAAWNGVVRYLGRSSITMLDIEREASRPSAAPKSQPAPEKPRERRAAGSAIPEKPRVSPKPPKAPKPARKAPDLAQPLAPMGSAAPVAKGRSQSAPAKEAPVVTAPVQSTRKQSRAVVATALAAVEAPPMATRRKQPEGVPKLDVALPAAVGEPKPSRRRNSIAVPEAVPVPPPQAAEPPKPVERKRKSIPDPVAVSPPVTAVAKPPAPKPAVVPKPAGVRASKPVPAPVAVTVPRASPVPLPPAGPQGKQSSGAGRAVKAVALK